MSSDEVKSTAQALLKVASSCYGHCKEMATIEFIGDGAMAAQVCPSRYVSRIVVYKKEADPESLRRFVQAAAPGLGKVESADVRVGSRYAWDLGVERANNDLILKEVYWTQNYRRTKNENPDRLALFLCSNKDSFFVQSLRANERFCQNCRQ